MPSVKAPLYTLLFLLSALVAISATMKYSHQTPALFFAALSSLPLSTAQKGCSPSMMTNISLSWYAPAATKVNSLSSAINGTGVYGFIFDSSQSPPETDYNWCNMPHTHPATYTVPDTSVYKLEYVEVIHRHHKRTPYADNTFPVEGYAWDCSDEGLFYGGKPLNPAGSGSADTYWSVYTSDANPFPPEGFDGTCQFPQITRGGLDDSHQHGVDLKAVYYGLLNFLPADYDPAAVEFRVTNNVITSQVASMLIPGLYPSLADTDIPLKIQPDSIDSLEPTYTCPHADDLFASYGPGSRSTAWLAHLQASSALKTRLDHLSGVDPEDEAWSKSWDHCKTHPKPEEPPTSRHDDISTPFCSRVILFSRLLDSTLCTNSVPHRLRQPLRPPLPLQTPALLHLHQQHI